jgi:hypothetical protein
MQMNEIQGQVPPGPRLPNPAEATGARRDTPDIRAERPAARPSDVAAQDPDGRKATVAKPRNLPRFGAGF